MNAEVISVGTELLLGQIVDTDAAYIAQMLSRLGIDIYHRVTVGDNAQRLSQVLKAALGRADLIITIGGLGPTMDDLTKETVADALGVALVDDPQHRAWLEQRAQERGWKDGQAWYLKQAQVPEKGRGIANPNGTALGAIFEADGKIAICLPGPPNELIPMVEESVEPYLAGKTAGKRTVLRSRVLRIVGMGESVVEREIRDLMTGDNPTVAPYAKTDEVHLRITARAGDDEEADSLIAPREARIRERLGEVVYGVDGQTLESVVVALLLERKLRVSAAESCSGGLIAKRITDIPDASRIFDLGLVTYSNEAKRDLLQVPQSELEQYGAVSPQVAKSMAKGALRLSGADIAVSVTGIAGPGGGSAEKPVGTVHVGIAWDGGVVSEQHHFLGRRADIAQRSSQAALALVRLLLIDPHNPQFRAS